MDTKNFLRIEQLPDFPEDMELPEDLWPTLDNIPVDRRRFGAMVAVYVFDHHGRYLVREESHAILCKFVFDEKYRTNHGFCDRVENPEDKICAAFQALPESEKTFWSEQVRLWFRHILTEPKNRTRAAHLHGYQGRLPRINYPKGKHPMLDGRTLEGYEVCTYYAMLIWCKKLDDTDYNEKDITRVLRHHLGLRLTNRIAFLISFFDPREERTALIAAASMKNKDFFCARAEAILMDYEQKELNLEPQRAKKIEQLLRRQSPNHFISFHTTIPIAEKLAMSPHHQQAESSRKAIMPEPHGTESPDSEGDEESESDEDLPPPSESDKKGKGKAVEFRPQSSRGEGSGSKKGSEKTQEIGRAQKPGKGKECGKGKGKDTGRRR